MKQYSVEWSVGGKLQIPADGPDEARAHMASMLPAGPRHRCDWVNIDVEEIE